MVRTDGRRTSRPAPASIAQQAAVALLRAADAVRRDATRVVEPHGLTLQQFNVLRILRGAGDVGLPTLEVGARMIEQTPGTTRLLDRLEAKGLIRRERCRQDRRQHLCWITEAGREVLEKTRAPMDAAHDASLRALSQADRKQLLTLLERIPSRPSP